MFNRTGWCWWTAKSSRLDLTIHTIWTERHAVLPALASAMICSKCATAKEIPDPPSQISCSPSFTMCTVARLTSKDYNRIFSPQILFHSVRPFDPSSDVYLPSTFPLDLGFHPTRHTLSHPDYKAHFPLTGRCNGRNSSSCKWVCFPWASGLTWEIYIEMLTG